MNEILEPLSAREKRVLELAAELEPPSGAEQRVFASVQASIAALPPAPSTLATDAAARTSGMVASKTVASIAGAMLMVGAGAGVLLGRTVLAPEPLPPRVIERTVRVEVPVPAVAVAEPEPVRLPVPAPPQPKKITGGVRAEPAPAPAPAPLVSDELLAQERELIDTARSALLHGDGSAAIVALQLHVKTFPMGRLDEERESLWVQALVLKGSIAEAKAKAVQFHQKFPRSLLGPTVDAALFDGP